MNIRAVLSLGLYPVAPAKPTTPDTAGSFRMTAETSVSSFANRGEGGILPRLQRPEDEACVLLRNEPLRDHDQ